MNGEEIKTISTVSRDSRNRMGSTYNSNPQTSDWSSWGWEFHSDLGWCNYVPCELGMWSIRSSWPWLHLYLLDFCLLIIVMEHIQSKRDCVSGVTAIYFVEPTERNVGLILDVLSCLKQWFGRISWRLSRLLEQRVVLIGWYRINEWRVGWSIVGWMTWVVNPVYMTRWPFDSKEVRIKRSDDLKIFQMS